MISKKLGETNMEKKKCDEFCFTKDERIDLVSYYSNLYNKEDI